MYSTHYKKSLQCVNVFTCVLSLRWLKDINYYGFSLVENIPLLKGEIKKVLDNLKHMLCNKFHILMWYN